MKATTILTRGDFVFLEASRNRLSVPKLYADYWQDFDEERDSKGVVMANRYWRERERQGRLTYPRIDLFFYHYTVLVRAQETLVSHVFQSFKEWWQSQAREIATELGRIVTCSSYFQEFISPEGDGHVAEFSRLIKALDVSTIAPVYLALRERLADKDDALKQALADLASFVTR